jgi:hypothetical protein
MIKRRLSPKMGLNEPKKESRLKCGLVTLLLVTLPSISFSLFQGAAGSTDGWDELIEQGPSESTDGWDELIEQGPSESTDGWDELIEQGPSESTDGWDELIEQGPPSGGVTDQLIEAMESGAIDPDTAAMMGNANNCGWKNMISNLQGPVIENGFEITHTDPTCQGMTFNGR